MDEYFSDSSETIESYGGNSIIPKNSYDEQTHITKNSYDKKSPSTKSEKRINESKVKEFFKKYLLIKKELDNTKETCIQLEKENRVLKIVNKRLANQIKSYM
jgi:hypothetical protein